MKQSILFIFIILLLTSGCVSSNNSDSVEDERDVSVLESATSPIENSNLKITYNITQLEDRRTVVDYWVESGKVRMVETSNNLTEYRPPESSNSNISITCEETCTWDETRQIAAGPILRPEGDAEKGNITSVEGNQCTDYSVSEVSEIENYFEGVQFRVSDPDLDYCINEDTGIIHETRISTKSDVTDHELESSLINSENTNPREIDAPEVITRTENCTSNTLSVVTTENADSVELEILEADTANSDIESLERLNQLDSITVETESSWRPTETTLNIEDENFIVAPLVDGERSQPGSSSCLF